MKILFMNFFYEMHKALVDEEVNVLGNNNLSHKNFITKIYFQGKTA